MDEEFESLTKNRVWELVKAPTNARVIDCKWTYKLKRHANGNVQRHKARLVARGFQQREGIDYQETHSPVVRFDLIRAILAVATPEQIKQFDVKTAFLYGNIDEEIYVQQPEGYSDVTGKVCKLRRSLYGLQQSSHEIQLKSSRRRRVRVLKSIQKPKSYFGYSIYRRRTGHREGSTPHRQTLAELKTEFEITHNDVNLFLGMHIEREADGSIFLHQETYARRVRERFRVEHANPVAISADPNQELFSPEQAGDPQDIITAPYREAVGSLMYLSVATRPDITFAVNQASRFLENPTTVHWKAVKRILKYLKGTINHGVYFKRNAPRKLLAYSDSAYAGDLQIRRSTTVYVLKLASGTISWNSQRQQSVALSTTDAEYMAACQTAKLG